LSTTIIFASQNEYKIQEIKEILLAANLQDKILIRGLDAINFFSGIPETSNTIEGNAVQKASYIYEHFKVNCFAEDTGLEIEHLNGEPGVYSARYAGEHRNDNDNVDLVLKKMSNASNRSARFKTVIALIYEGNKHLFKGICEGSISFERIGDGGFGYDPIFIPRGHTHSFGQMSSAEKNKISHRSKALKKMLDFFRNSLLSEK